MFALWLERRHVSRPELQVLEWHYECDGLEVDNWRPDFFVISHNPARYPLGSGCLPVTHLEQEVIEYKPSKPTNTYLGRVQERFGVIHDRALRSDLPNTHLQFRLYWGNCFSGPMGFVAFFYPSRGGSRREILSVDQQWITPEESERMRSFRFDLEA
jgi:hypothetical protein